MRSSNAKLASERELRRSESVRIITVPGIGGSGEEHWQTYWEKKESAIVRFQPSDWDYPDLQDWIEALDRTIDLAPEPPVLVAHSLACLLVAHWAAQSRKQILGAFLVSVPDPDGPAFPAEAASFKNVPTAPLPFPALIVASTSDPFGTLEYSQRRSHEWRTGLVVAGALGHINATSGLAEWPQGFGLLQAFCAGLRRT
jgi:uncharacterized protein